ncbi:uncharacterized protein LOC123307543 [Coccinella septempunctata]|uniref:uncharacterized protein LOC123307543 n=1 Tax=Coccinella septempunctata TaxID=41139 RepID=UPI001D07CAB6|nr:uncharacterized protein LOC123307543 [Coccinella septempunctata]
MKVIVFCFVLIALYHLASAKPVDDLDGKWEKFKADFQKKYDSPEEEARRKELFRQTAEQVEAHNALHAQGLVTYTQGINHFADLTSEERKKYLGFGRPKNLLNVKMKVVVFCVVLIAVFNLATPAPVKDVDAQWEKYKTDFNKKYDTPAEETRRKQLFVKSLEEVESHNLKYEQGLVTWTKGINQFSDWTPEEFKKIQGVRRE